MTTIPLRQARFTEIYLCTYNGRKQTKHWKQCSELGWLCSFPECVRPSATNKNCFLLDDKKAAVWFKLSSCRVSQLSSSCSWQLSDKKVAQSSCAFADVRPKNFDGIKHICSPNQNAQRYYSRKPFSLQARYIWCFPLLNLKNGIHFFEQWVGLTRPGTESLQVGMYVTAF
jgi:hypothetical protein